MFQFLETNNQFMKFRKCKIQKVLCYKSTVHLMQIYYNFPINVIYHPPEELGCGCQGFSISSPLTLNSSCVSLVISDIGISEENRLGIPQGDTNSEFSLTLSCNLVPSLLFGQDYPRSNVFFCGIFYQGIYHSSFAISDLDFQLQAKAVSINSLPQKTTLFSFITNNL